MGSFVLLLVHWSAKQPIADQGVKTIGGNPVNKEVDDDEGVEYSLLLVLAAGEAP